MERMRDARGCERVEENGVQVGWDIVTPDHLDPPLKPTIYRCSQCGHEHVGLPSLKNPT
jgi:hypothetical protein